MTTSPQDLDALVQEAIEVFSESIALSDEQKADAEHNGEPHDCNEYHVFIPVDGAREIVKWLMEYRTLRRDLMAAEAAATERAISRFENYFADDPVLAGHGHSASLADELRTPEATTALDAVKRAERAQTLRDAAARAYEVAHNTNDISQIRDAILAMNPEEITESDS